MDRIITFPDKSRKMHMDNGHRQFQWFGSTRQEALALLSALHRLDARVGINTAALIVDEQQQRRYQDFLGQTLDLLVYSAWSGFSASAFAALSATVRGGGRLVLLTPHVDEWPEFNDPDYVRLLAHPWTADDSPGHFLKYMVDSLQRDLGPQVQLTEQRDLCGGWDELASKLRSLDSNTDHEATPGTTDSLLQLTPDQTGVLKTVVADSCSVHIITAARGRGKSVLLGKIAAAYSDANHSETGKEPLTITSVHRWQCAVALDNAYGALAHKAPDAIIETAARTGNRVKQLYIDEAAAMPLPMLLDLAGCSDRLTLSSTSFGYEGSGQGFRLRLTAALEVAGRRVVWHKLEKPIRWASGDPLDEFVLNRLLFCLPAGAACLSASRLNRPEARLVDKAALAAAPQALASVMRLLMESHYQTTPDDARTLLDSPGMRLYGIFASKKLDSPVALALVDDETRFDSALADSIWQGTRRPRGHLSQQVLAQQMGIRSALFTPVTRIVRIAVAQPFRRQGLATALLNAVAGLKPTLLSASFASDEGSLGFWLSQNFTLVRTGSRRSGSHGGEAMLVLRAEESADQSITASAVRYRSRALAIEDQRSLSQPEMRWPQPPLADEEIELLHLFASGARQIESVLPALIVWLAQTGRTLKPWSQALELIRTGGDWSAVCKLTGTRGRKTAIAGLRRTVAELLSELRSSDYFRC